MGARRGTVAERWERKIDRGGPIPAARPDLGPCWLWTGATNGHGYGRLRGQAGEYLGAHRVGWEMVNGPVPEGLTLDHLCRVRLCVNPAHLEPVPMRENTLRGSHPWAVIHRSGRCARGHDRAVHGYARKDRPGTFNCRECRREARAAAASISPATAGGPVVGG